MASQDDTPQQKPTPGGSADTEQDRPEQGAQSDDGLSDASETIVSGEHAVGTEAAGAESAAPNTGSPADGSNAGNGAAADATTTATDVDDDGTTTATDVDDDGTTTATDVADDDGLDHDDWDAAFADAAGTPPEAAGAVAVTGPRNGTAGDDADVVPGGHPSLAQRSSLPMRHASTMPNLNGYADLSEEEQREAGDINAVIPSGSHAAHGSGTEEAATAAGKTPAETPAAAAGAGAGAAGLGAVSTDAAPRTMQISTATASAPEGSAANDSGAEESEVVEPEAELTDDYEISAEEARRRAEERERAGSPKPVLARILQVMIAVFFPVMLLAAAIRAVATPLFLWIEYHRPGFPADGYGFSTDDRMTYGSYAVDYLLNFSGARYLGDLVTAGGEPLYLDSEVSHMADVKTVLTVAFVSALVMAVLSVLACVYLAKRRPGGIRRALFSGAVLTLVLVGALIVTAVLGWENFFTQVHSIFFANGNWTFRMDDTLIRLFPAQFWMDAGIGIAGLVLLTCIVVLVSAWPTKARRERARSKQEAARRRYLDSLEAV
ncbi:TIGR01906 family membrane protein [Arthrobacter sp. zg-Y820]|uniref:TIGR01906 family membrane protein n=1 Tax=unclassified Arthrobacter TaxID=235627 RepID=UPI0025408BC6|nr:MULTISPECIES: TIGR01906 family membrane protein [unclassified Arthrobacter]MCC9197964.1 TIGR01906 family membrane protein [Arthrobacter sp. zg-Y820]MDK1280831.1 TIGR01906 family membrane protein [Arthrobacter sp. zg.Y820]WIB10313.1 TIGR01906 family membrane protein [Arthrobacter sp. zg-Y820]